MAIYGQVCLTVSCITGALPNSTNRAFSEEHDSTISAHTIIIVTQSRRRFPCLEAHGKQPGMNITFKFPIKERNYRNYRRPSVVFLVRMISGFLTEQPCGVYDNSRLVGTRRPRRDSY